MEAKERPSKLRKLDCGADDRTVITNGADDPRPVEQSPSKSSTDIDITPNEVKVPATKVSDADVVVPSKTQLKKLRKKQEWEAGREERKIIRKQKNQEKKVRRREARDQASEDKAVDSGTRVSHEKGSKNALRRPGVPRNAAATLLPVTLVIDCGFGDLMHEKEHVSLAAQITRAYSDNHRAPYKAHLVISSWGGELRTRFDTVLNQHYKNWRDVTILEGDFVEAASKSTERMRGPRGGKLAGAFSTYADTAPSPETEDQGETVYLTADSDETLERLKPHSTYIIGGLVDKNRHKGICYKSACDRGIKTAKLPIGKYMDLQNRHVLTTNHVVEIMIRWLACGDWGEAFLSVMPKRKGGKLKSQPEQEDVDEQRESEIEQGESGDVLGEDAKEAPPQPSTAELLQQVGDRSDSTAVDSVGLIKHANVAGG